MVRDVTNFGSNGWKDYIIKKPGAPFEITDIRLKEKLIEAAKKVGRLQASNGEGRGTIDVWMLRDEEKCRFVQVRDEMKDIEKYGETQSCVEDVDFKHLLI